MSVLLVCRTNADVVCSSHADRLMAIAKGRAVPSGGFSASDPTMHTFGLGFFQRQPYIQLSQKSASAYPLQLRDQGGIALLKYYSTIDLVR
jgi:hypothetical protein